MLFIVPASMSICTVGAPLAPTHPFEFVAEHDDASAEAAGRDLAPVEINVDYILMLVEKYRDAKGDGTDKEVRAEIQRAVDSSPSLRNKKDLIEAFVDSLSITGQVDTEWRAFVEARRTAELDAIITDKNLNPEAPRQFIETAFRDGAMQSTGIAITKVLPAMSRFAGGGAHSAKKQSVLDKLSAFVDRFLGLA